MKMSAVISMACVCVLSIWNAPSSAGESQIKPLEPGKFGLALSAPAQPGKWVEAPFLSGYAEYPITVEGWIKLRNGNQCGTVISSCLKESFSHWGVIYGPGTGELSLASPDGEPTKANTVANLADDQWHYVALLIEEKRQQLYVDGTLALDKVSPVEPSLLELLKVESPSSPDNYAFVGNGAKPAAVSSELAKEEGEIAHVGASLNDGQYGNNSAWIPSETKGFFQIDLGTDRTISLFTLGRDRAKQVTDRQTDYIQIETSMDGANWTTVFSQGGITQLEGYDIRKTIGIFVQPVTAHFVKVTVSSREGEVRQPCIDEFGVFGPPALKEPAANLPALIFGDNSLVDPGLKGPLCIGGSPYDKLEGRSPLVDEIRISKGIRDVKAKPSTPFTCDENTISLWHFDAYDEQTGFIDESPIGNRAVMTPPCAEPTLALRKGIVIDRRQWSGTVPPPDGMEITDNDIEIIKSTGVDHIKLLITPHTYITADGIKAENMWYIDEIVNLVVGKGLPVVVCIHPELPFKYVYLASSYDFQKMLKFYEAFAAYMAQRWTPEQLAFELMTEPFGNAYDWTPLQYRMWETVRRQMPKHTLILSGDRAGHISGMPNIIPVNDSNVMYMFTTYDPTIFTFQGGEYWGDVLKPLAGLPYPSTPENVEAVLPEILAKIPVEKQDAVRKATMEYGYERWNKERLDARLKPVLDWNASYGNNLRIWIGEFGALGACQGGVKEADRWAFFRDTREVFEAHNIGWSYWSYNEVFTIMKPEGREPFDPAVPAQVDTNLIEALGLPGRPIQG